MHALRPSWPRAKRHTLAACAAVLLNAMTAASAEEASDSGPVAAPGAVAPAIQVRIHQGLLTLNADGATLADVLRAIGEEGAFRMVLRGRLDAPVRDSFADQPLVDAVRRLVAGHSLVIIHGNSASEGGASGGLAEIQVIARPDPSAPTTTTNAQQALRPTPVEWTYDTDGMLRDREDFRQAAPSLAAPRTREEILFALGQADPAARMAAIPLVGGLRPHEAGMILSDVLDQETEPLVRSRSIAALTKLGRAGLTPLLREALSEEDASLRMQALNALAASHGVRATTGLGRALREDFDLQVRLTAVRGLQRVGGTSARSHLEQAVLDLDPAVSRAAEVALASWPEGAE